jgi:hypothetical protein
VDLFGDVGYERLMRSLTTRAEGVGATIEPGMLAPKPTVADELEPESATLVAHEDQAVDLLASALDMAEDRESLINLYLRYPEDFELFYRTLGNWSDAYIAVVAKEAPDGLAAIVSQLNRHLPQTGFAYSYLNVIARLLGRIFRITEDRAVRDAVLRSLLEIGMRFDEIDMGKEFAGLAGRMLNESALYPFVTVLREDWRARLWVAEYLSRSRVWEAILRGLSETGIHLVDLGDVESEKLYKTSGWDTVPEQAYVPKSPSGDKTLRRPSLHSDNTILFHHLATADHRLTAEVSPGYCEDSFQILIENTIVYEYSHSKQDPYLVDTHTVHIPMGLIKEGSLAIVFRYKSSDDCVAAGVYNVRLEPIVESNPKI